MKRRTKTVLAAISVLVAAMLLSYLLLFGLAQDPEGFKASDLETPAMTFMDHDEVEAPGPLGTIDYPVHLQADIAYPSVYEDFGSVIEVTVNNRGTNDLFVWSFGLRWEGDPLVQWHNGSARVEAGDSGRLGMLYFTGPGAAGVTSFEILLKLWASSANGNFWSDKGEMVVGEQEVDVLPEPALDEREVEVNVPRYYDKLNDLVDFDAMLEWAVDIEVQYPAAYDLVHVIMAYEMVRDRISYLAETDDHWQPVQETLSLGTGDCEDHAILLASLVTALGGDCRINLIEGHAFATVFVGDSSLDAERAADCVRAYYATGVPVFWLQDGLGYWMVIDSVGMPYAGGYPAASVPVGAGGGASWNFEGDDWIINVDVTGEGLSGIVL